MPKAELQNLLDTSNSYSNVMRAFGMNPRNGAVKTLMIRIKEDNLDDSYIRSKPWIENVSKRKKHSNSDVFIKDSSYPRHRLKKRIIDENLIPYVCSCGNTGQWNGKPLSLQLEHKNGINNDNRLSNLGFLCPNCHSQTSTYAGKNR